MAGALQCDRCKKFFTRDCTPDLRVNFYRHPYGDTWYDLCEACTGDLGRFLRNETVETRKENIYGWRRKRKEEKWDRFKTCKRNEHHTDNWC